MEFRALKDPTINISWALLNIRNLGSLTDYSNAIDADFFQFQELLDRLDPDEEMGVNDIRKTMEMVRFFFVQLRFNSKKVNFLDLKFIHCINCIPFYD